jgi:RNA polymerase sigma-70 factor (ECF subfamily)
VTTGIQEPSDEELARKAQAGCSASFEALVHRYEARVFRFAANTCCNASDAQEVTQDAFVSAYRSLEKFDTGRSFETWLFTIARRKCIDHHRSVRSASGDVLPEEVDANDPAELLAQREAEGDLWQLAKRVLPSLQFEALWLRHAEDMSVAEVAQVLRLTKIHVKVLLFRARLGLDAELTTQRTVGATFGTNGKPASVTQSRMASSRFAHTVVEARPGVQL